MSNSEDTLSRKGLSRRDVLAGTAALAAVISEKLAAQDAGGPPPGVRRSGKAPAKIAAFPYESLRDYMAELERRGLVLRFDRVDQDAYEGTALMYRAIDAFGMYDAPALVFDSVKIDGRWMKGPLIANHQGHWDTETLTFGIEPVAGDGRATYRKAIGYLSGMLGRGRGKWPTIAPQVVSNADAPCKTVILEGDDIDLLSFPFIQSNPGDAGRYINTASVFTSDVELGKNFGTYRCQIKGPRKIGVNPEPGQTGWKMLMAARKRGEKTAGVSLVLGQDPLTWVVSGSMMKSRRDGPVDELALAGGLRGKPLKVVKSETNDMLVPANAEMVIEGVVPLQEPMLPEGPFGEMYGYMGARKEENFWMNVTRVTHRLDPWYLNSFTGATRGFVTAPLETFSTLGLRRFVPQIHEVHSPVDAVGWTFVSIKKSEPGQGLAAGEKLAEFVPIAKIVVVVDDDVDILDTRQVMHAVSSRWQPDPASKVYSELRGMPLDPSLTKRPMTSKMVIDATRQLPGEGGPETYPAMNRALLVEGAPDVFAEVDAKFGRLIKNWKAPS